MGKKSLVLVAILALVVTSLLSYRAMPAQAQTIVVTVNGKPITMDVPPTIINGRTLVPFRAIFEALGATVDYDAVADTARGTKGHITVALPLGRQMAYVNGAPVTIEVPAIAMSGRTLVPGRFVAETLGAKVDWVEATKTVVITSRVEPKVGGEVVLPIGGDPTSLNPILTTDAMSSGVWENIYNGLLRTNEKRELIGDLAQDWSVSADNLTITFRIRQGIKWHDGVKFTAQDVKFTYDTIMHADYTGVRAKDFKVVQSITCPDDYTLVMKLSSVDASLLSKLTIGVIPKHIFAGHPIAQLREHPASRKPIGTGPFKLKEWVSGQYIVLDRNPDYFWSGNEPYLEQVRFRFYTDTQATVAALQAGDIDYMGAIPVDEIDFIKQNYATKYSFHDTKGNGYWYIGMKQDNPIFSNKNVRQALAYGLDRTNIVSALYKGYGTVINADKPISAGWAYNPNLNTYAFNTEKAKQLLAAAGWNKVGSDGIRTNAAGERLSFTLISASGNQTRENLLQIIKNQWNAIGVEAKIELFEISVYYDKLDAGDFEIYQWGWNLGLDPDNFIFWHSTSGFDEKGILQGYNDVGFSNKRVDELIEKARGTFNQEIRRQCYWEIQEILNEELPYVFLYSIDGVAALNKRVKGDLWSPMGRVFIELWHVN